MRERRDDRSRGVAGPLYGFAAGGEVTRTGAAISRAPIVSADYCCDHRNQGPRDSCQKKGKKNRKSQPRSPRAEEIIIIIPTAAAAATAATNTVIITAITRAKLTTQKPAAPPACLHSHACPFIDCAPRFQIRLRARRGEIPREPPG